MKSSNHTFHFYFTWILIGLILGFLVLLWQGQIQLTLPNLADSEFAENPIQQNSFADAVALSAPSVVSIQAARLVTAEPVLNSQQLLDRFLGKNSPHAPKKQTNINTGSGVILDSRGYILTNLHVVKGAEAIRVELKDGRNTRAALIGYDPDTDLAVLKIELTNLPQAKIADLSTVQTGDVALAIGYPFNIGQTVTQGIISATGRTQLRSNTYANFLQTDAAINPGNSGGALINANGEIIGINSLIFTKTGGFNGIGFAIPIDLAKSVLEQIAEHGYVIRGWLGVGGQNVSQQVLKKIGLNDIRGILITEVDKNGPGDKAGLKPGDIITRINKQALTSVEDIIKIVAAGKPGDAFEINGLRMRQSFKTKAVLGQRPAMSRE